MNFQDRGIFEQQHQEQQEELGETRNGKIVLASTWEKRDWQLLSASFILICGLVSGTYHYCPLLAAFEQDASLEWTPSTTSLLNTLACAAESLGLVFAGPLADHLPASALLSLEAAIVCATMFAVSLAWQDAQIIMLITSISLFKGMMWPSVVSLISANMSKTKHDMSFSVIALGSRLGDMCSALLLGFLMKYSGLDWRRSLIVLLFFVFSCCLTAFLLNPGRLVPPKDRTALHGTFCQKWRRLLVSLDGWLAFITLSGTYCCWALDAYLVVILQDVYGLSPGTAAACMSCIAIGCILGLLFGALATYITSVNYGRALHVLQASLGVGALVVLAIWHNAPLHWALVLLSVTGFGFVVPAYVPQMVYAANSPSTDRAFRAASIDGASSWMNVFLVFIYGKMREHSVDAAASKLYGITAVGLLTSCLAMALLYWRLPHHDETEPLVPEHAHTSSH